MAQGAETARGARVGRRMAAAEAGLSALELVLCGLPLALWVRGGGQAVPAEKAIAAVAVALLAASLLRLADGLRPIADLVRAKRRQETVVPDEAEAAQRALARVPRESALVRFLLWVALYGAELTLGRRSGAPGLMMAGVLAVGVGHAAGAAALRALVIGRALACLRPTILPHVEGIRVFAAGYRRELGAIALAALALAHGVGVLLVFAFAEIDEAARAVVALLVWAVLPATAFFWWRSLGRRTAPIEQYLDATVRAPATRGPAREDPRAVAAFRVAQALPYRLGGYLAFALVLAGVLATAAGRRAAGLDVADAARTLGVLAVACLATVLYGTLAFRRALAPLIKHLGSRHHLPVGEVRSRLGVGGKLLACIVGVAGLACMTLGLAAAAPQGGPAAAAALAVGLGLALGFALLCVRELVEPIAALEARSDEMARGELARPLPPSGEADEIGRLTVAFEEMRRSLRDRLRSTESINVDLEREVRRRTEALEQRNTELREALEKLRRAQDDLVRSEKLASMGRLVAGIAHEINNPVNAVINSVGPLEEVVQRLGSDPGALASADEILAVIKRGAERAKAIVQALHNYSRGEETIQREVPIARSVDNALDLLRHRLRHVRVVKQVDTEARILGFAGQIDQVLMNLVTNAAQALGDRAGEIHVRAEARGREVVIAVADDGPGIPADVLPRIFDPFFTTKDVGEGSGLGLSIVHGIVERHGGRIDVESTPGHGTTFTIVLPRLGAGPAASAASTAS